MHRLLPASLLLAGYAFTPATAQPSAPSVAAATATGPTTPTAVAGWVGAEFSEAYGRYFTALPPLFRYTVSQSLRGTPLLTATANPASLLQQDEQLRERVYQAIYQYCHTLKYGLGRAESLGKLVYGMLYSDFHLSDLAATQLTPYLLSRYAQPVPPFLYTALATDAPGDDKLGERTTTAAYRGGTAGSAPTTIAVKVEAGTWRLAYIPPADIMDDTRGLVLFRVNVTAQGTVASVTKLSGSASPDQVRSFRDALLEARFVRIDPAAPAKGGSFTFRYSIQ
jgi:hypothetical protein